MLLTSAILRQSWYYQKENNAELVDVGIMFGIARFFCGILMHMLINDRVLNGLSMMKYAVNHEWKFAAP